MRYLILLALLALAFADDDHHDDDHHDDHHDDEHPEWHGCGALQRLKVLQQWNAILGVGTDRTEFGVALYRAYFKIAPEMKEFYVADEIADDTSPSFRAVVAGSLVRLNSLITSLSDEATLQENLRVTAKKHNEMHLPHDALDHFGHALEHVIPARLGRCFDLSAWTKCYNHIAHGILEHREHHEDDHTKEFSEF